MISEIDIKDMAEKPAYRAVKTFHEGKPVYVAEQPAQRTWVALTDEDIRKCSKDVADQGPEDCVDRFAYAIEAKLKDKNT